jgi:hypothetical protein
MVNFTNAELINQYGVIVWGSAAGRRLYSGFRIRGLFRQLFNECVITENLIHPLMIMIWDVQEVTTFWK